MFDQALFEGQLQASVEGILAIDLKGEVLWTNRRFAEMWTLDGAAVTTDADLFAKLSPRLADPEAYLSKARHLAEHPGQVSRDEVFLKDGRVFDRYSAPLAGSDGAPYARVWYYRDITERKRTEEELRAANDRLRELNQMKNQFVNTAAHELSTPITPIGLQIHLLRSGRLGPLTDPQRNALELTDRNLERLSSLMRDILDAADAQSDKLPLTRIEVDVPTLLRGVVAGQAEAAAKAHVRLQLDVAEGLSVNADLARLTQVVRSLVDNAIKFSPQGGEVQVRAGREGPEVVVHVRDQGIGLAPEDFRRIFQPFSQVHDTMQHTKAGPGLGLVIAQGVIERHGGRIWCDSPGLGKGATFSFALPSSGTASPTLPGAAAPRKRGVWPLVYFRCPVCESRDINMRIIKNKYECGACKHTWR